MSLADPVVAVDQTAVIDRLCDWAGCRACTGGVMGIRDRVVADYLRHHLVLIGSRNSTDGVVRPVHIHRLRASVRHQLEPISDWLVDKGATSRDETPQDESELQFQEVDTSCLDVLQQLMEVVHCGGGYYLPTPLRAVTLASGRTLLIGGLSTHTIIQQWNCNVEWAGFARCTLSEEEIPAAIPRQSPNRWLRSSEMSLREWTAEFLVQARACANEMGSTTDGLPFEVYDPYASAEQHRRWIASHLWKRNRPLPDDMCLCRTQQRPRRFWLSHLSRSSHGLRIASVADVQPENSRRLMYGLDQLSNRPVRANIRSSAAGHSRVVSLGSWPTDDVLRLLVALGYRREHRTADGRKFLLPLHFEIAEVWWHDIRKALENMGIKTSNETDAIQDV